MSPPRHLSHVPHLDEPGKIQGVTILVVVECQQCDQHEHVCLVNAQPAACPSCGAILNLDAVSWSKSQPTPKIALSATLSRGRQLTS